MPVPTVFISYSHKDEPDQLLEPGKERWLTYVQSFLNMGEVGGQLKRWDDTKIKGGDKWHTEIERALDECSVFILLVSRHSLTSEFIRNSEVERILSRTATKKARIFPIVVTPNDIGTAPWLAELNLRPPNGTALSRYGQADRDEVMVEISKEIREILRQESGQPRPPQNSSNGELAEPETPASARRVRRNDVRRRRQQIEDLIGDDKIDLALKRLIDFADDFCPDRRVEAVALKTRHRLSTRGDVGGPLELDQIDVIMEVTVGPALKTLTTIEAQLSTR
jgi:hypothetical protein